MKAVVLDAFIKHNSLLYNSVFDKALNLHACLWTAEPFEDAPFIPNHDHLFPMNRFTCSKLFLFLFFLEHSITFQVFWWNITFRVSLQKIWVIDELKCQKRWSHSPLHILFVLMLSHWSSLLCYMLLIFWRHLIW